VRKVSASAGYAVLFLIVCTVQPLSAQSASNDSTKRFFDLTAGLGISIQSAPLLANYINALAQPTLDQKVDQFNSVAEFYFVPELQVSKEWSAAIEYSLLIKSYSINSSSGFGRTDISYEVQMPSVLVHYLVFGEGFRLKLGGGVGYHFVKFDEAFSSTGSGETLRTNGLGFKLDAIGNTKFDETFYGSIGVDLRWDFLGSLSRGAQAVQSTRSGPDLPKMTFFTAGVKFGVTFQLF
jgi:hypothetical protein